MTLSDHIAMRWVLAVLGSVGFVVVYGLKVNLSVAIIAMVNHTAIAHADDHHAASNESEVFSNDSVSTCVKEGAADEKSQPEDGPFEWNENVQGLILAAYFYGYIFTQVLGGWVAEKFSAKHVFGVGAFLNAVCTIVSPPAAQGSYIALVFLRVIMGFAGGVTLPAMHVIISKWAPKEERSKISSTIYAGMTLGTLISLPFSGILASSLGWSWVFYIQGTLSLVWYILWLIFVYDSPEGHPMISLKEKQFIQASIGGSRTSSSHTKPSIPWKQVWTSKAVWAIIIAHTCSNWGWYMLLVKLPTYMRYILEFDIKSNAGLSAVPFLCMWGFTLSLATLLDYLRGKSVITTTVARKIATFIASIPPGLCLIAVTFVGCNTSLAVVGLTLGTMFMGGMYSGFLSNHIDIAPPFAGTLMGITNTFATLPGIVVPSFVGYMTHGNQTVEAWRIIFIITLVIFFVEAIAFIVLGSGEQQSWVEMEEKVEEHQEINMKYCHDHNNDQVKDSI